MKKIIFISTLFLIVLSCKKEVVISQSEIRITTSNEKIEHIELFRPVHDISMWDDRVDSIFKADDGSFAYKFNIEKPEYAKFKVDEKYFNIFLLPNQTYQINISDTEVNYYGDNALGQETVNNTKRDWVDGFDIINKFAKDTTALLISNKINSLKNKEISKIDSLLQTKNIDEDFYKLIKTDIDYYYASAIASLVEYKSRTTNDELKEELLNLLNQTASEYPYQIDILPPSWNNYVMNLHIYPSIQKNWTQEERQALYEKDSIHPIYIYTINKEIDEAYQERLKADYIMNSVKQIQYEKSLVAVFDKFKRIYPNSHFLTYLEDDIDVFRDYHNKVKQDLSDKVSIIKDETIDNFEDLAKKLKGEKLYVDMWATWCGPCKKEFEYNEEANKVLKANNYKKLYVSLDNAESKDKWIEMIKYYNLEGYHHLASRELFAEFEKNYSNIENAVSIPQYLLINEKGEVLTTDAPRPSEYKKLSKMLIENSYEKITLD